MKNTNLFKILILFFLPLYAFNVNFTKIYKKYIIPNKPAILIKTKEKNLTFPFTYIRIKNGYIIYGDMRKINYYLDNEFYAPADAKFKNIKIAIIDTDKLQYKIINQISNIYKKCSIKNIIFLSPDEEKIILKPKYIILKYKVTLDCK